MLAVAAVVAAVLAVVLQVAVLAAEVMVQTPAQPQQAELQTQAVAAVAHRQSLHQMAAPVS
jgi:hypothetical protein